MYIEYYYMECHKIHWLFQAFVVDVIIVTFELLDVSPIPGDIHRSATYSEVSLDDAANTIAQMIQNGQFVVSVGGQAFINVSNIQ